MSNIIHQIWITENNEPFGEYISSQVQALKLLYNNYTHRIYNNEECREIIKKNIGEKSAIFYDKLKPNAFKADFARYLILYVYGGYYYDISLCPEYKFECVTDTLVYKGIAGKYTTNNMRLLENNFLYFKNPKHKFLEKAINDCLNNIRYSLYHEHPLSITGPIMLGKLDSSSLTLGEVRKINNSQYASFFDDKLHLKHKPIKYQADLSKLGNRGTNNYEKMWFEKNVFRDEGVLFGTNNNEEMLKKKTICI